MPAGTLGTVLFVGIIIFLCILIFRRPLRLMFRLVFNVISGFILLFIVNFFGGFIGITLGYGWLNILIVGIFGLPGVGFLLMLRWLLLI